MENTAVFLSIVQLPQSFPLAEEALQKLGVKTDKSTYWYEYNSGMSDQIPTGRVIAVDRRVRRKIGYNGYEIYYERIKKR